MKVSEIIVSAGRTFNDPYESYANHKPHVTFKALLEEGDDVLQCTRNLQAQAEASVEQHKRLMLAEIERLHRLGEAQEQIANLAAHIRQEQARFEQLKRQFPELADALLTAGTSEKVTDEPEF